MNMREGTQDLANEMTVDDKMLGALSGGQSLTSLLRFGMAELLADILLKERDFHLQTNPLDRANGFAPPRVLHMGTTPIDVQIPRTRNDFYPGLLPKYQRHIPHDYEQLLRSVLLNAKSFNAVARTLKSLGLSCSEPEMTALIEEMFQEAEDFYARPLNPDYFLLCIDAKIVCLRDDKGVLSQGVNFLVIGVNMNAEKEILLNKIFWKRESIDAWREVLTDLKNRGVCRIMLIITDDFSGLTKLVKGFFPQADRQLCTVHLLRNAYKHMNREDYKLFAQGFREICSCSSCPVACEKFVQLCNQSKDRYKAFFAHVLERTDNYLAFTHYPNSLWNYLRTSNSAEAVNNQIEIIKRNAGGHFHTDKELTIKTWILASQLKASRWKHPVARFKGELQSILQMFYQRYESEAPS